MESSNLVPGDIFEVTDPELSQVPCDSVPLSGDCIMNESMLTGKLARLTAKPDANLVKVNRYQSPRPQQLMMQ